MSLWCLDQPIFSSASLLGVLRLGSWALQKGRVSLRGVLVFPVLQTKWRGGASIGQSTKITLCDFYNEHIITKELNWSLSYLNYWEKVCGFETETYVTCINTERHVTCTVFILLFLCSRSSGGTKGKSQKLWAPTPGFMTGYPKMTCLVSLTLSVMHCALGKTASSFVFPLKWLIWSKQPHSACGDSFAA